MGQSECLKLLKKNKGKWLNLTEIKKKLKVSSVTEPLHTLANSNDIERRLGKVGHYEVLEWRYV